MDKLNLKHSEHLYEEAKALIPGGVIGIRRPLNFVPGEYPIFIKEGKGGRIKDVDGNKYIDMLCSYGPIIIGHAEDEVDNAVIEQIKKGFCFNLAQDWQNKLAKKLRDLIPCAEQSFFVKTGSDATTSIVRMMRAHSGKPKVIRSGYHGWHDWCVEVKGGILPKSYEDILEFHYNDLQGLEKLLKENEGEIAGIIMTPIGHALAKSMEHPKEGFLEGVRKLADQYNVVLAFDEVRTGFRFSLGGAQEYYGVTPDIAAFGKAMANGYPISVVCGKKKIMDTITEGKAFISSTFFPNSLEMVASLTTIEFMEKENVIDAIWQRGETFMSNVKTAIEKTGVKAELSGFAPMSFIAFPKDKNNPGDKTYKQRRTLFFTETIRRGLFLQPYHHGYIAFRHSDEDIERACGIIEESFKEVVAKLS